MIALSVFGSIMIISSKVGINSGSLSRVIFESVKQLMFALAAWFVYCSCSRINTVQEFSRPKMQKGLLLFYAAVMFVTCFAGSDANGSRAWLYIGPISLQPSEFGKPILILLCVSSLLQAAKKPQMRENLWELYRVPIWMFIINVGFLIVQKDIGSLAIFSGIFLICLLVPSYPGLARAQKWIRRTLGVTAAAGILVLYGTTWLETGLNKIGFTQHIAVRIENMKDPYIDIDGNGMQPANALFGIADSGIFGKGLGSSVRKYGFLTQAENDYIIAVVIEEFGILGLTGITAGYLVLFWRLIRYGLISKNMSDKVLFSASGGYLMLHYFINIGGVSTLIPMTGVPLLFISAGGTSLLSISLLMGVCQHRIALLSLSEGRQKQSAKNAKSNGNAAGTPIQDRNSRRPAGRSRRSMLTGRA